MVSYSQGFLFSSPLPTILQTGVSDIQSQQEMCGNVIISGPKNLTQGQKLYTRHSLYLCHLGPVADLSSPTMEWCSSTSW